MVPWSSLQKVTEANPSQYIRCKTYPDHAYLANPNHDVSVEEVSFGVTTTSFPLLWQVLQMYVQFSNLCWYLE